VAARIVFKPDTLIEFRYSEISVAFTWVPGMAKSQVQKSIVNLHQEVIARGIGESPLEVSTKSLDAIGVAASAMNLTIPINGQDVCIESVYQSSKVFEEGGPYVDLLNFSGFDAKRDERLKNSGNLLGFEFEGESWPLNTGVSFYDWLYISALNAPLNSNLGKSLAAYDCFTDINYSQTQTNKKHGRSFNCQARSAAMFVSAYRLDKVKELLEDIKESCFGADEKDLMLF
jgi:hypothetical protein